MPSVDPLETIADWLADASARGVGMPEAMTVATVDEHGRPSARTVLLRGVQASGLVFFTNYESRKGRELTANPVAAVVITWTELERQVRAVGPVRQVDAKTSDAYFAGRPRGSQLAAWASPQSEVLSPDDDLAQRYTAMEQRFGDGPIPRPAFWGGYLLTPDEVEFWEGRRHRLHDRVHHRLQDGRWTTRRLAP